MEEIVTEVIPIEASVMPPTAMSVFDKIEQPDKMSTAMENSINLMVKLRVIGTRRKVSTGSIEVEADKNLIHVSKDILESETLKKIKKVDGKIRAYIDTKCLPYIFRNGIYLLPITSLEKVDNRLTEFKQEREDLVQQFINEYESIKLEAEPRLGALFNPQDYPAAIEYVVCFPWMSGM